MNTPTDDYVHQALVSDVFPPRPWCGGAGRSVMRKAEVTCPDCLQLDADRKARAEVHDTHAIPATDEPEPADLKPGEIYSINGDPDDLMVVLPIGDSLRFLPFDENETYLLGDIEGTDGPLTRVYPPFAAEVKRCPSCPHCGKTFHVEPAPVEEIKPGDVFRDRVGVEWTAVEGGGLIADYKPGDENRDLERSAFVDVKSEYGPLAKAEFAAAAGPLPARDISECAGYCVGVCTCAVSYTAEAFEARYELARNLAIEPAKTHDLSIDRKYGNDLVTAEGEAERRQVYLPVGVARDLGRVLAVLTPAQIALLVDDLTGGEK